MALFFLIGALLAIQGFSNVESHSPHQSNLLERTWSRVDQGEVIPYVLLLKKHILSEGNTDFALGATFTIMSELYWYKTASACGFSKLINAVSAMEHGTLSWGQLDDAIESYAVKLAQAVENLRLLGLCCVMPTPWPPEDNTCGDYGRIYDFDTAWDTTTAVKSSDIRCVSRSLYLSMVSKGNNAGAAATAAATDPAVAIIKRIRPQLENFLSVVVREDSYPCNCRPKQRELRKLGGALRAEIFAAADAVKESYRHRCHN